MSGRNQTFLPGHRDNNLRQSQIVSQQHFSTIHFHSSISGLIFRASTLIVAAEKEFQWGINLSEVLRIWQGGCIIRSRMLEVLPAFYSLPTTADASEFTNSIKTKLDNTSSVLDTNSKYRLLLSEVFVIILWHCMWKNSQPNLIQAMRDSFGAHGVKKESEAMWVKIFSVEIISSTDNSQKYFTLVWSFRELGSSI